MAVCAYRRNYVWSINTLTFLCSYPTVTCDVILIPNSKSKNKKINGKENQNKK